MMPRRRILLLSTIWALIAGLALAHGGYYTGPNSNPGGSGRPGPRGSPRGGGTTPGTQPTWRNWWDRNREEFFDLRARRQERSGAGQEGYASDLHQEATLADIRETITPTLVAATKDKSTDVRDSAAIALGRAGAIPTLEHLQPLLDDSSDKVRSAAILGIGLLRHPMAEQVLVDVLNDPKTDDKERAIAAFALGLSGGERAQKALSEKLGSAAAFGRVAPVKRRQLEGARALGLGLIGKPESVGILSDALKRATTKDRTFHPLTLLGLAKLEDPSATVAAFQGVTDRTNDVVRAAAILLGRTVNADNEKAVERVIRYCANERDAHARGFGIMSLGRIGGAQAAAYLTELVLKDRNREVRGFAAVALGMTLDAGAAATLGGVLVDEKDATLRGAASIGLGILGDAAMAPVVHELLTSVGNPELRGDLITALAMLGYAKALPDIRRITGEARNEALVRACGFALALLQDESGLDQMLEIMKNSGSIQVKGGLATALGRTGDRRAIEPLVKLVADTAQTDLTRAFAIVALGLIGDKSARTEFSRLSIDSNYAQLNAEALLEVIDVF